MKKTIYAFVLFASITSLISCGSNNEQEQTKDNSLTSESKHDEWLGTYSWNWKGDYNKDLDYYENASGDLIIEKGVSGDDFKFNLVVGSTPECTGQVKGSAKIENSNTATYQVKDEDGICSLKFTKTKDGINVEEIDCLYYHGAGCSFDGNYKKQ